MAAVRPMKSNPAFLSEDELVDSFVARQEELARIIQIIRDNTGQSNRHVLVIGQRGLGKTMLVLRVAAEVRRDTQLSRLWHPIVFAEESYQVTTPGGFWLEAISRLAEETEDQALARAAAELYSIEIEDDKSLEDQALARLLGFADTQNRRLLVVVENFGSLIEDQMERKDALRLLNSLAREPRVMVLVTTVTPLDDADRIGKKAIQLFEQLRLDYLNEEECKALWTSLTGEEPNDDRIRALKILTGGNPRLLAIVATFAAGKSLKSLMESLTRLVDDNTEYFKRYLDELPPVERKVFTALLTLWDQATPSEVATAARVSVARASTMLHRLRQRGMVGEVKASGKTKWYQAAERMYNIYYLVRRRGDRLTRVEILVRFIVAVFGPEWAARVVLDEAVLLDPSAREDHDLALHRILELAPDAPTRQRILSELASKFAGVDASGPTTTDPDLERFLEVEAEVKNALVGRGITGFLEAESLMPKAEDAAGESPEAWVRIAHYWHRVFGEWEMAERAYEKALSLRPDRAELWAGLAEVRHRRLQSYEKAESAYREALQLNKDDASTWAELGDLLQDHLGRYDEAEQAYRQSLKRETDPWVYEQLARLYSDRMGRLDDAEQTLRYLVKLKPRYTRGWMSLAELLQDRRQDYGEAARVLRKATESSPKQSNLWGLLGNLLFYKMGLLEEAEEAYRRALEGRGYRWHAIVGLVRLLLKREGGAEEAFQIATKAFSQERPTRPRDERVLAHAKAHIANEFFENGQWAYLDQMETWTLDALKEEPNNPDFLATAACILAARGKVAESLDLGGRYLERAKQDDRFVHNTLQLFLEIAAAGSPKEALLLLQDSPKAAELEPLVIALQLHLREDVTAPVEMREVAEEIVKRIEKRRAVIELKSEGGEEVRQEEKA